MDDATSGGHLRGAFISRAGAVVSTFVIDQGPLTVRRNSGGMAFGGGQYLATYYKTADAISRKDILYGRLISPTGTVGNEIRLSAGFGSQGNFQNVAFDGARFFVVWNNDDTDKEVKGRFITPGGILGSEISIKSGDRPTDNPLTVAFDGANYLVAWTEQISEFNWDVFGRLVTPAGAFPGGVITISSALGQQFLPLIAFDGTNYLVSWTDMRNDANGNWSCDAATEGTCTDVYGQYVSKAGAPVGSAFIINNSPGDQVGGFTGQAVDGRLFGLINTGVNLGQGTFGDVLGILISPTQPPADEQAIRDGLAAAVGAINAGNMAAFMAYVSPSYLDDGQTWANFQVDVQELINDGGHLAYVLGTISIQGDRATVPVTWTFTVGGQQEVDQETLIFRKEGTIWLLYGNQQRHYVRATSHRWANGYSAFFQVRDHSGITSITVSRTGITGSVSLTRTEGQGWSNQSPIVIGTSIPATPPTYTITVNEGAQSYTYTRQITGWVQDFATNLSPTETAGGPVTFTWTGIAGAAEYAVELSDANFNRLWNKYSIPPNRPWAHYDGPALVAGKTYRYWVSSQDANQNASFAEGQFTYSGPTGITFTQRVTSAAGAGIPGVAITIDADSGTTPSATTDSGGNFILSALPQGSWFVVKMTKDGFRPTYTALLRSQSNLSGVSPFTLLTPTETANWPVDFATKGVIATRVVDSAGNNLAGVLVTAQSMLLRPGVPYIVTYRDDAGNFGGSATHANGRFFVRNVDEGDVVTVTATKSGYTFTSRSYFTHAGGISQGLITGTLLLLRGDIDGNGLVNLADAVLALKVISGLPATIRGDYVTSGTDVNGDGRVGIAEAIYILQHVAGVRAAVPIYSISGMVSGATQAGVTINLSGAATKSTTTDSSGNYSFTGLADGNYTLTPVKAGFTFHPASMSVTVSGANMGGRNFVAAPPSEVSAAITLGPDMNVARLGHQIAALSDGRVIVFGGHGTDFVPLSSAEVWSPSDNRFTKLDMKFLHDMGSIALLNNGTYLLAGGASDSLGVGQTNTAEIYNPADNSFTATGSMNVARVLNNAATLKNGKVLVVGNWYASAARAELYDPGANTFSLTEPVVQPRAYCLVLPAEDGGAVVLGGTGVYGGPIEVVEVYNSGVNTFSKMRDTLFAGESGWTAFANGEPINAYKMQDGRYILLGMKFVGAVTQYQIFTFNPVTKAIEKFNTQPSLPDTTVASFGALLLNAEKNTAYLLASVSPYSIPRTHRVYALNLSTGMLTQLTGDYTATATNMLDGFSAALLKDGRLFLTGGSTSPDYYYNFSPHKKTFFVSFGVN